MSIIDVEFEKIQEIKSQMNTSIKNKGGSIDDDTPFEEYPNKINSIPTTVNIRSLTVTPSIESQTITATGDIDGYNPITVNAVTSSIDSNITANNIKSGVSILGVAGSYTGLNGSTVTITPTLATQNIYPESPSNGITTVNVNAVTSSIDNNIIPSNIKSGVSILGVAGTYYINQPGIVREIDSNGKYQRPLSNFEFSLPSNITDIGAGCLFSGLTHNTKLISVNLRNITTISGSKACQYAFFNCNFLTSIDLSNLKCISGLNCFCGACKLCTSLVSVNFSSLTDIIGDRALQTAFENSSIPTLSFPSLSNLGTYTNQFRNMLYGVTGCTVHFPAALQSVIGSWKDVTAGFGGTNTTVLFDL